MKRFFSLFLLLVAFVSFESCFSIKLTSKKKTAKAVQLAEKPDPKPKKGDIQPYEKVITKVQNQTKGFLRFIKLMTAFFMKFPIAFLIKKC